MDPLVMQRALRVYRGKRVFVTGDTGFKGSWLAYWLYLLGAEVAGLALPPSQPHDHYEALELGDLILHSDGDIRDREAVSQAIAGFKPEFVFHLAAQPLVRRSYQEPKVTFDTNVGGSVNVLEAIRETPSVKVLIYVTSDKCYENLEWEWGYRETDRLGGRDPYSASKAAAELVHAAYEASYWATRKGFGAASVRAGNVIGGGDWSAERLVPDCVRAILDNRPIVLRRPASTRPWQYVLEPLGGYLLLGARLYAQPAKYRGAWNFGPASTAAHTVHDVANMLIHYWARGRIEVMPEKGAPHEAGLLHLNCDKALARLGWRARWDFEHTLLQTVFWYKGVHSGVNARAMTRHQIQSYMGVTTHERIRD